MKTLTTMAKRWAGVGTASVILTAALVVPTQTAVADTAATPVGTWTVTTKESDHDAEQGTIAFNADHTLLLKAHNGPDGQPVFTGTGEWRSAGDNIAYDFTHPIPGTRTGTAYVALVGTFTATSFSASGETVRSYDDGGLQTVSITMTGTR